MITLKAVYSGLVEVPMITLTVYSGLVEVDDNSNRSCTVV